MAKPVRNLREILGKTEARVFSQLVLQTEAASEGVLVALNMIDGTVTSTEARESIGGIESNGDWHRKELIKVLQRALVTPIDREDIYRVSRYVDDILDNLRDFVREFDFYRPKGHWGIRDALEAVEAAICELRRAALSLLDAPSSVIAFTLRARKYCNEIRVSYQRSMSRLFDEEVTGETMKQRELLSRLEKVSSSIEQACDAINDGLFKRHV